MNIEDLSRDQLLKIAELLADDRLDKINNGIKDIEFKETFYVKYIKRIIDILISSLVLVIFLPINLIIFIITLFDVGFPIFFFQDRVGKDGEIFKIVKFRNMKNIRDKNGDLLPPSERVTKWGKFVRGISFDELLNFYNILKGDMSIIGPRPLVTLYYKRYNKKHLLRFKVKPGLELPPRDISNKIRTWNDQFENDVWYVQNISFKTDLKMFINLVKFAFNRTNSKERGFAKRGSFMGYSEDGIAIDVDEIPDEYIKKIVND